MQETFLRAWRSLDSFEGRTSWRSWLYRIATNACLNFLATRARAWRVLPESQGLPSERPPEGGPASEVAWLQPYPDALLEGIADTEPGPDVRYEMHETVQLAFVAAIQYLPPRQRAALLLRDVLGWSAAETAGLLDTSVASTNSALQRARATLEKRFPSGQPMALPGPDDRDRSLLQRYVQAWEDADLDGFAALLRDDAVYSMPPGRSGTPGARRSARSSPGPGRRLAARTAGSSSPRPTVRRPSRSTYAGEESPNGRPMRSSCLRSRTAPSRVSPPSAIRRCLPRSVCQMCCQLTTLLRLCAVRVI